jgi:hypothetical protein
MESEIFMHNNKGCARNQNHFEEAVVVDRQ